MASPAPEAPRTIIVKPASSGGWTMLAPRTSSAIHFHGRQRAIHFARAYAKLNPPVTLRVLDETGEVELEEVFDDALRGEAHVRRPIKPQLVSLPRK
jgi:hypothetical protein